MISNAALQSIPTQRQEEPTLVELKGCSWHLHVDFDHFSGKLFHVVAEEIRRRATQELGYVSFVKLFKDGMKILPHFSVDKYIVQPGNWSAVVKKEHPFYITINTTNHTSYTFEVVGSDTIEQVKQKFRTAAGVPIAWQQLFFHSSLLQDDCLDSYGIRNDSVLSITLNVVY